MVDYLDKAKKRFEASCMPVTETGCWLWLGTNKNQMGHGGFSLYGNNWFAHRASWFLNAGVIPDGECVLHRCDVPSCVNPGHLFLGTKRDNLLDMWAKNRGAKAEKNGHSKIDTDTANKIRSSSERSAVLGDRHGISRQSVADIRSGRTWRVD